MFAKLVLLALPLLSASVSASPAADLEERGWHSSPAGWKSYGCHFDCYDGMNRYLPHLAYADENNSARKCTKACAAAGYKFAGLQFGKECWCGDAVGGQLTNTKECHNKCKRGGNCGGPCRNFIWGQE